MFEKLNFIETTEEDIKSRCVIRLSTSYWHDRSGIHMRKNLIFQKKRSINSCDILAVQASNIGACDVFPIITNLNECEDGLYEVIRTNISYDRETGECDFYDFKLIPFKEDI